VPDAGALDQISAAAFAGFDAIGLRLRRPAGKRSAAIRVADDAALAASIRRSLRDHGIGVLDVDTCRLLPDTDIADWERDFALAAELGARFVLVTEDDPDLDRTADGFADTCELAHRYGLRPMLEFVSYRNVRNLADACNLVTRAGHRSGGVCIDALHLSRSGGHPAQVRAFDPHLFGYMHLCDAPAPATPPAPDQARFREAMEDRQFPGEGALWLDELLDALPAGIAMSVEIPHLASASLPPGERAQRACEASRRFLARRDAVARGGGR